jgi:tetratricopeptide (TPR) repeat protein
MANNNLSDELLRAEGLLVQGEAELALELLARLAEDAEEYVDRNCPTTDELQWFSFPSVFERLAYRRVEQDPRELRDVGEPLDRLYADLALAHVHCGDYESAAAALRQAVRWNPMGCEHRLNLADLCRIAGDMREHLALSFSVFERASEASHLVRAYLNFAAYFQAAENPRAAAACLHVAQRIDPTDQALQAALEHASGTEADPANVTDDQAEELLAAEGLPEGANAEIAVCLLMCAGDAAALGDRNLATGLTLRARDLVGEKAAMALLELIRSDDEEADDAS